jgi:hypothetical protein
MYRTYDLNWRIATTEALLAGGNFWIRRLPPPAMGIYVDHSQRVDTSDYGQALRGIPAVTILWDQMTADGAADIREMIETVLDAGNPLWLTIDLGNGQSAYRRNTWADVYGVPVIPDAVPAAGSRGLVILNYRLIVNNPTIENNPATGL